jgi:hypothetical protein
MPGLFLCTRSRAAAVELVPRGRVAGGRKFVDTTTLRRINEKARTVGYGPTALPRLFEDANRALLHVAHAVSFDRMQGRESPLTDATVWNRGGVDVLLVVWWVRLLDGETVALAIGAQPSDFLPLESTVIGEAMLERAHEMPVRCPPRRRHPARPRAGRTRRRSSGGRARSSRRPRYRPHARLLGLDLRRDRVPVLAELGTPLLVQQPVEPPPLARMLQPLCADCNLSRGDS